MDVSRVKVRRAHPSAAAWALALLVTMLAAYLLTLGASMPDAVESVSAAPRVTRRVDLEPLERWCVSMGRYEDAGRARIEAAGCAAVGGAGLACELDGAWRVLGALYETEREAKRVSARLDGEDYASETLRLVAPSVALRVSAPARQIDAIAAADAQLAGQADRLGQMARQVDRGEIQPEAARTLCGAAATETERVAGTLAAMPDSHENALCARLVEALGALSGQLGSISASDRAAGAALSGMLRLAELDAFLRLRALRQGLLEGTL